MKKILMQVTVFLSVVALLVACGGNVSVNVNEIADEIAEEATVAEEPVEAAANIDFVEGVKGKWAYVETQTTIGEMTTNMKVFHNWTLDFTDSTYVEFTQLAEEESGTTIEGSYGVEENKLIRADQVEVEILELTETKMVFSPGANTSMVFEKTE